MSDYEIYGLSQRLLASIFRPFPIRTSRTSGLWMSLMLVLWITGFLRQLFRDDNFRPGEEFGTARWADPDVLTEKLGDLTDPHQNKILSEHVRISLNSRKTGLNNNVLIIGGSGSGKTFYEVKPNAFNLESSTIFCDPKGELLRDTGSFLQASGVRVRVLNLVNLSESDGYNPFEYLEKDEDVVKLIDNLIANTTPKGASRGEAFWTHAESMYLQAIMYYVWLEYPRMGKSPSFRGVLELLNQAKVDEHVNSSSELDKLMFALPENHPALISYKKVVSGAADTVRSIFISANARLAYMQNPEVLRILDHDEMHIPSLGLGVHGSPSRKSALFCVIPDSDKSLNFVVGMLYTQIFQVLYRIADETSSGRLPIPVSFWMDEFANVALPDAFPEILATCRSREISCNVIIQNMAQLRTLFRESWETMPGNCDICVYLGGNEQSTHEYISRMAGRYTLGKHATSESFGRGGGSSESTDVLGRDLLTPDEVGKLDRRDLILKVRGFDPVIDEKYRTWEMTEFREAQRLGGFKASRKREAVQAPDYYLTPGGNGIEDAKIRSFRYMVEKYGCIFRESPVFRDLSPVENGYLTGGEAYGSYVDPDFMRGEAFLPVFEAFASGISGPAERRLERHRLCGCLCRDQLFLFDHCEQRPRILSEEYRLPEKSLKKSE